MKKKIIAIIAIVVAVGILAGFGFYRSKVDPVKTIDQVQEAEGFPIEVGNLTVGDIQQTVELTGNIKPLDKQIITGKVAGKVEAVYVREGDTVRKGQALVKLEQDTYRDALKQAQMALNQQKASLSQAIVDKQNTVVQTDAGVQNAKLALKSAEESLKLAKLPYRNQQIVQQENAVNSAQYNYDKSQKDAERYKGLYEKGAVSLSDYENMKLAADVNKKALDSAKEQLSLLKDQGRDEEIRKAELGVQTAQENLRQAKSNALQVAMKDESIKMIKASIDSAQAQVDIARDNLKNTLITSKVDGIVSTRTVDPGQTVSAGTSLGEIVSVKDMYYLANVSEIDIDNVKIGQVVDVTLDGIKGQDFTGKVAAIYPVADASTRGYSVKIKLTNATTAIKAGMFADGLLNTNRHDGVIIAPQAAIKVSQGITSIFVVDGDKVKQVNIEIVSKYLENAEIVPLKAGELKGNEEIATSGIASLSDGTKIKIESAEEIAKESGN
ncbi:MAG: efflux RND transporter periplasmic adaptor subunit [Abditibacteriota bacterium]|nr:efflux RND transporter periplasmic adaptor subunit [Abditibacteriota bacterium]